MLMFFFLFVIYLDEIASIRTIILVQSKEFICYSKFVIQSKAVCRTQAQHGAMLMARIVRKINNGLDERICGRQQQHERLGVGSEAGVMFA